MNEYIDPVKCPTVCQAMGVPGMLSGYPLIKPIEPVPELERTPEEPEFDYDEEGDDVA